MAVRTTHSVASQKRALLAWVEEQRVEKGNVAERRDDTFGGEWVYR